VRTTLSQLLVQLATNDPNIILITGDHGYALFDDFRNSCPEQYLNAGIAEQNMVGVAAGLARQGFRPIVYGLSAFVPIRVLEQIKLDVAHDSLPVIFLGDGAGFVYSHLGTSHQSTEDIAVLRAVPNVTIFSPADRHELTACFEMAYEQGGTTYIRLGKADLGDVHTKSPELKHDSLLPLVDDSKATSGVVFIGTGSMASLALRLATETVPKSMAWSAPILSRISSDDVMAITSNSKVIVTLEEHSVNGGLGGLITEKVSEVSPRRVLRIGVDNRFSEFCGTYSYLLKEHGLDHEAVSKKVLSYLEQTAVS
jgi:transketolase